MAFYRIYPSKDTSIANGDPSVGTKTITGSNVGASEILNLYRTVEEYNTQANILVQFDLSKIPSASLAAGPEFWLHLSDAQHAETLPTEFGAVIDMVSASWSEGAGHDMDYYTDIGAANWVQASVSAAWASSGGDRANDISITLPYLFPVPFFTSMTCSAYFSSGHEDMDVDVFKIVELWLNNTGTYTNNGFYIYIDPLLTGSDYYIKKFHSRQTHFPTKKPYLEVRWTDWTGSLTTGSTLIGTTGTFSGSVIPTWATALSASSSATLVHSTSSIVDPSGVLVSKIYDLKSVYESYEVVRLHLAVRSKDYNPATVATASSDLLGTVLMDAYYRVVNERTGMVIVPYGTGSSKYTKLSWNDYGNFFDINMASLPTGTLMRFDFIYNISGTTTGISGDDFTFRIR